MSVLEKIDRQSVRKTLQEKVEELVEQPEYRWGGDERTFAVDGQGRPAVRVGIANCELDFDIWEGLRNPATVGMHPVGLRELWEFYAHHRKRNVDATGRPTIFKLPRPFSEAKKEFSRAVLISVMLPIAPQILQPYSQVITQGEVAPLDRFNKALGESDQLLDQAVTRLSFQIINPQRAVVVMNGDNTNKVTQMTVPETQRGGSHGVSKGGNYPQKSVAVLTGLGQFGVSRLVIRDEIVEGEVKRFIGRLRSLVIFDREPLVTDGAQGILHLNQEWKETARRLADFTETGPQLDGFRFCPYLSSDEEARCNLCVKYCPSGAQSNSVPNPEGEYGEKVKRQRHRFWEDKLQFDYANCCDERGQMAKMYDEWSCGRCLVICGLRGGRSEEAARNFSRLLSRQVDLV